MRSLKSLNIIAVISTPKSYSIQSLAEDFPSEAKGPADIGTSIPYTDRLCIRGSAEWPDGRKASMGLTSFIQKVDLSMET